MLVEHVLDQKGREVHCTTPVTSVLAAAQALNKNRVGCMVVVDGEGRVAGMFSERDLARGIAVFGDEVLKAPVSELMTKEVITCKPTDTVEQLMGVMTRSRIRHVPVMHESRLVGMVSIGDIVKNRLQEAEQEIDHMRHYVAGAVR